ncbi:cytosolic phospholipase A2 gamma-like [Nelusetta ayraudi]|uniref:cytosolic phospholipase A2 gamma-like n=1 Tax=Nelusetta ayraudi TaxID=303726 RepID=UPI003F71A74A
MEGNADARQSPIRQSGSLCAGEKDYVNKRKQIVLESLKGLGINSTADDVPHIALLSPGGGQRSAVALMGALHQMEADGLLGTLLYLGGISGSTWSMSLLYSDPEWSTNMSKSIAKLSTSEVSVEETLAWLGQKADDEDFSLSHVWGAMTSTGIMKQLDVRCLSGDAHRNASNPYPVYCAIEKHCLKHGPIEGKWFEFTPHEAGFTEMGLFVETSLLGSKFQAGGLLEKQSEMDMVELQGILGSALADLETDIETLKHMAAEEGLHRVYKFLDHLLDLLKDRFKDHPHALYALDALKKILYEILHRQDTVLWASMTPEERKHQSQQLSNEMLVAAEDWSQNLEDGPLKSKVTLIWKLFPLMKNWEWGTTASFLYQYKDPSVPSCFQSKENLHLIDAGLHINTPYPPFLGEKREIDLIITPEFSAGEMFETLTLTSEYAAHLGKPFPAIDAKILEDREWPKDCYVLEGKDQEPTIVYMPLFNRRNCKDAAEVKARMKEFSTFQLPYSKQKIHDLAEIAKANILNNKKTLLQEIKKAALRKQSRNERQAKPESVRFRLADFCWGF